MTLIPRDLDVWVLAGQSNMEGVGVLTSALAPDPRVWSFTSAGQWEIAAEPLHCFWESFTPIHQNLIRPGLPEDQQACSDAELAAQQRRERRFGAGLGLAFGQVMAQATGKPVGLIPAAHGGTSLEQWSSAGKAEGGNSLYGAMLLRIARAGGNVRGVLWYQGESETWDASATTRYGERFTAWVTALRTDLNRPDLPILTVQLGRTTLPDLNGAHWDIVRQAQYDLPDRVPFLTVTSAIDLALEDVIHINTAGLVRLGTRLARQMLALDGVAGYQAHPRVTRVARIPGHPGQGAVRIECTGVTGGWHPTDNMAGFGITDAAGQELPNNRVFNALPDPEDPSAILLRLNLPAEPGERITYAQGLFPYANVSDQADMPLCAFAQPVE